jgi:hypothetical protein
VKQRKSYLFNSDVRSIKSVSYLCNNLIFGQTAAADSFLSNVYPTYDGALQCQYKFSSIFIFYFCRKMKTGLMILLLIHLVSVTLAAVVPAAVNAQVTDAVTADKKDNVIITSTESVESAESIESLGSNDPKLTSGTPAI